MAGESRFAESQWLDYLPIGGSTWMGWRLRITAAAALLGSMALLALAHWLGGAPNVDASWRVDSRERIELTATNDPALQPHVGERLIAIVGADGLRLDVDTLLLQRSSRWLMDDAQRARHRGLHTQLARILEEGTPTLVFSDGSQGRPSVKPRGSGSLGGVFWLFSAFALVLYLVSTVVLLARPTLPNALFALMSICQAGNLVFIAIESTLALGLPPPIPSLDMPLRMALDLATAAAIATTTVLYPQRLPGAGRIAAMAWGIAVAIALIPLVPAVRHAWWWTQGAVLVYGLAFIILLSWSVDRIPHPFARLMRRFAIVTVATLSLLIVALAMADAAPRLQRDIASIGSMIWYVFFGAFLLLIPFVSKSQHVMPEFWLLAAISTVATSLDLMFVAVFSLGTFASLTLSLFLSLGVYAGVRQWVLNQWLGGSMLSTERMFEQLYGIAREVQMHPERTPALLAQLLRDMFEPMELTVVPRQLMAARVVHAGSALLLAMPQLDGEGTAAPQAIVMRFARRGQRLFTQDDARLADRIVEQLRRAVQFDKAVEHGRSEERTRIAQDLHDDIGARLLTLMYKSSTPEMEEYIRNTLKDLKTLTRGLAASSHWFSHAAAEWKADLGQRLALANIQLDWKFAIDDDVRLSVVQWSALTRVLRELVSNVIAHSQARRVSISVSLVGGRVQLRVADDGIGRSPRQWSHGLGLGGVRKRVKQLGGEVDWTEADPKGIVCIVNLSGFSSSD